MCFLRMRNNLGKGMTNVVFSHGCACLVLGPGLRLDHGGSKGMWQTRECARSLWIWVGVYHTGMRAWSLDLDCALDHYGSGNL